MTVFIRTLNPSTNTYIIMTKIKKILVKTLIISYRMDSLGFGFYLENKENKRILLSDNYLQAKIYLEQNNKQKATDILKEIIFANDPTYSTLSLFFVMNQNLITNEKEILLLFNHLLENNKFSNEVRDLLIYKRALFSSNFVSEQKLLQSTKSLLNTENQWKPHALILLGDYFTSKGEYIKAIEFYQKIFSINNLHKDLYNHATSQLQIISNAQ